MKSVNIHEAKTHLSRLVEEAARGEGFIIAKAGKPMVKVVAIDDGAVAKSRLAMMGALEGKFNVPDDFDHFADDEIAELFDLKP